MAYCAQADLEGRISVKTLAQLTNDTANATTADGTIVSALIERADAFIDSYLAQVYDLPLATVPVIIKNLSIDLACFYAMQRRPTNFAMPKVWEYVELNARKYLQEIADEHVQLDATTSVASKEARITAPDRVFDFTDENSPVSRF